jgi:hypothetical protein
LRKARLKCKPPAPSQPVAPAAMSTTLQPQYLAITNRAQAILRSATSVRGSIATLTRYCLDPWTPVSSTFCQLTPASSSPKRKP